MRACVLNGLFCLLFPFALRVYVRASLLLIYLAPLVAGCFRLLAICYMSALIAYTAPLGGSACCLLFDRVR